MNSETSGVLQQIARGGFYIPSVVDTGLSGQIIGDVELALKVYEAVVASVKPGFRTNAVRRKKVEHALAIALVDTDYKPSEIYRIVERQAEFDGESMDVGTEMM